MNWKEQSLKGANWESQKIRKVKILWNLNIINITLDGWLTLTVTSFEKPTGILEIFNPKACSVFFFFFFCHLLVSPSLSTIPFSPLFCIFNLRSFGICINGCNHSSACIFQIKFCEENVNRTTMLLLDHQSYSLQPRWRLES